MSDPLIFYISKGDEMRFKQIAPIALTAISVVSSVAAVLMAIHDTPRAIEILDNHRLEVDPDMECEEDPLTTKEKALDYAKGYWKTGVLLGISVTSSIASCAIGHRNYKALATVTATLATAYGKHKQKVKQIVGEEKAKLIEQAVKKEMIAEKSKEPNDLVWFHDSITDTDFQMTWREYWDAKLLANRDLNTFGEISLGSMFPNIKHYLEDKEAAEWEWFVDDVLENYGYPWLDIWEEEYNAPYSENQETGKQDRSICKGRHCWVIRYSMWPLPPEIAKDYQYIGSETRQLTM